MAAGSDRPSLERVLTGERRGGSTIEALGDALPAGVFVTAAAGRCVYANARVQHLFGLSFAELAQHGFAPAFQTCC